MDKVEIAMLPACPVAPINPNVKHTTIGLQGIFIAILIGGAYGIMHDSANHTYDSLMLILIFGIIFYTNGYQWIINREVGKVLSKFELDQLQYQRNIKEYITQQEVSENLKTLNENPYLLYKHHETNRNNLVSRAFKPFYYISRAGYSEQRFIELLQLFLITLNPGDESNYEKGVYIIQNCGVDYLNLDNKNKFEKPFQPDICLYHADSKTYFDIEIDEPYTLEFGNPIHYDDIDQKRDAIFTDWHHWVVIRFTESQIFEFPLECAKYIFTCVSEIVNDKNFLVHVLEKQITFNGIVTKLDDSVEVDRYHQKHGWTYQEASKMAKQNYRQELLGLPKTNYDAIQRDLAFFF